MVLICEIVIFCMIFYEYKKYKIIATPMVILGGVYLLMIPMVNIMGTYLGFLRLTDKTIFGFTMFLCILFMGGQFWRLLYQNNDCAALDVFEFKLMGYKKHIWRVYLLGLIAYVFNLLQVINRYGIENTKSKAFGPFAHIGFISRCLFPIVTLYAMKEKKIKYLIAVMINLIALIVFKGKYHMYIAVSSFIVLFLILKRNINIGKVIKIVGCVFLGAIFLFVAVYTIIPNILAGEASASTMKLGMQFSIKHFFHYIFCPFIASNVYFDNPCGGGLSDGLKVVFNPIDILYQWILGSRNYFDPVITLWPVIDQAGNTGNVGGIFSETVYNIGYVGTAIYIFVIGFCVYHFLTKTLYKGKRILTTSYLLGMIMVCFFCNYFTLLPNLECFVICYLIDIFIFDSTLKIGEIYIFRRIIINDNQRGPGFV